MKASHIIVIFLCWLIAREVWSADDWYWKTSGQLLLKTYNGSAQLDDLSGAGVFLHGDYLERGGLTFAYNLNHTSYKSGLSNAPFETDENIYFLGGLVNFHPDQIPGRLTFRLDGYVGNDAIRYRISTPTPGPMGGGSSQRTITVDDEFVVMNPMVSFLNYAKTFYADLGYAYSNYRSGDSNTGDIDISQWTPTLGFGFNRAYDWLQIRGYFIDPSASNRVGDTKETSAVEAKWTHWFSADAPLSLHNARLSVLSGKRIFAVDSDALSLSNVSDLQTSGIAIGAEWRPGEKTSLLLQGGHETYESLVLNGRYSSAYLYAYMSQSW